MNPRFQELAQEAGLVRYASDSKMEEVERFAGLIVKECSRVADDWVNNEDNGKNYPSDKIKQHFGVEE